MAGRTAFRPRADRPKGQGKGQLVFLVARQTLQVAFEIRPSAPSGAGNCAGREPIPVNGGGVARQMVPQNLAVRPLERIGRILGHGHKEGAVKELALGLAEVGTHRLTYALQHLRLAKAPAATEIVPQQAGRCRRDLVRFRDA